MTTGLKIEINISWPVELCHQKVNLYDIIISNYEKNHLSKSTLSALMVTSSYYKYVWQITVCYTKMTDEWCYDKNDRNWMYSCLTMSPVWWREETNLCRLGGLRFHLFSMTGGFNAKLGISISVIKPFYTIKHTRLHPEKAFFVKIKNK